MKSRKEIIDYLNDIRDTNNDYQFQCSLELMKIGILLDIRDQNETIISHLNSTKKYSATSVDEAITDNVKEHYDIPIHS